MQVCLPPHAYVPGQTPRHPEDLFDALKEGIETTPSNKLIESNAWCAGLRFIQEGYFWEAHEVLEAVWMACPPNSAEKLMVQAVIQIANAKLKKKMGRTSAAERLHQQAKQLAEEAVLRAGGNVLGLAAFDAQFNA